MIGRAQMGNPSMRRMDEPSEGFAPRIVEALRNDEAMLTQHRGVFWISSPK